MAFLDDAKPSQRLLPQLNQLHEKLGGNGLVIVRVQEAQPSRQTTMERELAKLSPTVAALVAPGLVKRAGTIHTSALRKDKRRGVPPL